MDRSRLSCCLLTLCAFVFLTGIAWIGATCASAQQVGEDWIEEASRRTGLSRQELMRRFQQAQGEGPGAAADTAMARQPGRDDLNGIDDSGLSDRVPDVILPFDLEPLDGDTLAAETSLAALPDSANGVAVFGSDFFRLEPGLFHPPSFGPVPADYLLGVGDQVVVDVWGEVEFRLERIVDRDGSIILPRGGKIFCQNRTLAEVETAVRDRLAQSYSGISREPDAGSTHLDVSLGSLRAIRVFVVGDAVQPGAYQLSSLATVFTALYAAGGPAETGSMRDIRLMRFAGQVASLDLYDYLLRGERVGDAVLREGDTIFIPRRGKTVRLAGAVRRPMFYELKDDEMLADLLRFGGGMMNIAETGVVHIERILPPPQRRAERPDKILVDVPMDPETLTPADPEHGILFDGDIVLVDSISARIDNWVEIEGHVKRPGRFEYREGMDVSVLIALAGGLWPETLLERALIDRVATDGTLQALHFALGDVLSGKAKPVLLQPRDHVRVFSISDVRDQYEVSVSGEVRFPGLFQYRDGMTLRDLILQAGGLRESADILKAEVARLRADAVTSRDTATPPAEIVETIEIALGQNFLESAAEFPLAPHDHVAVRKLPWWDWQRTVIVRGEVLFPGAYSLESPGETLSEVISRAGGLKPSAFVDGARIVRSRDEVGNIAIDLKKALDDPGSQFDVILKKGDEIRIPEVPHTVKVIGAVGFPTSIVFEKGKGLGYYVNRAGGWADKADKWKTRVVYPNGISRPIRRVWRDPNVMPGSTIVVPYRPPDEGPGKLATFKEIASILASAATIYLVIDRATN